MPASRHFTVNNIKFHLPEKTKEVELEKWKKISYLLNTETEDKKEVYNSNLINMLTFSGNHMDKESVIKSLCEGALLIKGYVKAEFADVYLVGEDIIYRLLYKHGYPSMGASWPIGPGTIVAAYVAIMGQTIIIDDVENMHLYPFGTGREPKPIHLISTPILSENGNCLAVFEFSRIKGQMKFTKAERNMCACMVGWLGQSVAIAETGSHAEKVESYKSLFSTFDQFQLVHSNIGTLISNVMSILLKAVPMEKVNYYQIIEDEGLRCTKYEQSENDKWESFPEYKLNEGAFVRKVIECHAVKNMSKKDIDLLDETLKDQFKEIHSYLCVPIGLNSYTRGVVELINKKNSENFIDRDTEEANKCGIFCAAAYHYIELYSKKQQALAMCLNQKLTLQQQMLPCSHDMEAVKMKMSTVSPPPLFFKISYYPKEEELPNLPIYTWYIIKEVFKVQETNEEKNKFLKFIMMVKQGYRNISYHNFEHAFNFCHCMYIMMRNNKDKFSELERRALIIAALCHDIDHPGRTNKFLQDSGHQLTKLYNESFLENHHSCLCRSLIQFCGIFSDLSSEDYQTAIRTISYAILATDLSEYFKVRFTLMDILTRNKFTLEDKVHKKLLTDIMMTACDLCGQGKTFKVAERLCRNLYKEFYIESKCLGELGIEPISVMDADFKDEIPKYQINFITEVCLPCFYILSIVLHNTKELHKRCSEICKTWDAIVDNGLKWNVFQQEHKYPY